MTNESCRNVTRRNKDDPIFYSSNKTSSIVYVLKLSVFLNVGSADLPMVGPIVSYPEQPIMPPDFQTTYV